MEGSLRKFVCQLHRVAGSNRAAVMQYRVISTKRGSSGTASSQTSTSPDPYLLKSHFSPTPLPSGGAAHYLINKCAPYLSRTIMEDGVTGESLTYGAMLDKLHRWGAVIQKRTKPGCAPPTVAVYMHNSVDFPNLFLGCMSVGSVITPLNPAYTPQEVAQQIDDSGAELLVVDPSGEKSALKALDLLKELKKSKPSTPVPEMFVLGSSTTGRSDLRTLLNDNTAPFATPVTVSSDSVAMLPYSSGTTGRPKGVSVTHGAITANLASFEHHDFLFQNNQDSPDIILGMLPFYHIYGIIGIVAPSYIYGSKVVVLKRFQKDEFLSAIRTYKPTVLPIVPPILKFLIASDEVTKEDLQPCHTVICGAAPVPSSSVEKYKEKTGGTAFFGEGYGMTEVLVTHGTPRSDPKVGYCGKMLPNVMARVIDTDTGESLPPGQRGELLIKTPSMMAGYHNNPEATRETIDEDGWLHTGDIAVYNEEGFFSIVDRIKELIKVKGLQVSPSELEDVLLKHPAIADVGVVGVPHDRSGEVPRAYIIKSSKADISSKEVNKYMEEHLSAHKQLLGGVKFVTDLPKNPTGKLLRRVLREIAEKEL